MGEFALERLDTDQSMADTDHMFQAEGLCFSIETFSFIFFE